MFYWEFDSHPMAPQINEERVNVMRSIANNKCDEPTQGPFALYVEPNNTCNAQCSVCFRSYASESQGYMELSFFNSILADLKNIHRIHFQGAGEPLLSKHLEKMALTLAQHNAYISTTTNLTLLDPKRLDALLGAGIKKITVSYDSAFPDEFKIIRGYPHDRVTINLKNLLTRHNDVEVGVNIMVTSVNEKRIPETINHILSLGTPQGITVIEPMFTCFSNGSSDYQWIYPTNMQLLFNKLQPVIQDAKKLGCDIDMIYNTNIENGTCLWPWNALFVRWNGKVTPCCGLMDYNVGDLARDSLHNIWVSNKMKELRARHKKGIPQNVYRMQFSLDVGGFYELCK